MYNLEFSHIEVPFEKLQREREAMLYAGRDGHQCLWPSLVPKDCLHPGLQGTR